MNAKDRRAVAEAKRKERQQSHSTKTEQTGDQVGASISSQVPIGAGIEDKLVDLIGADIVQNVLTRLASGDFGKLAPQMVEEFNRGINNSLELEIQALKEWDESPKYALPSGGEFDG